jgi:hypothetical protein
MKAYEGVEVHLDPNFGTRCHGHLYTWWPCIRNKSLVHSMDRIQDGPLNTVTVVNTFLGFCVYIQLFDWKNKLMFTDNHFKMHGYHLIC